MSKRFKVLCIDGGGIKGLFSAEVLNKLEETYGYPISNYFDMICGTSTGGIIALAISANIHMNDIAQFYVKEGPKIFAQWKKPLRFEGHLRLCQALICSKYRQRRLKKALIAVFGTRKIGDSNNLLCIPAYSITTAQNRIFKKDYAQFNQDDEKSYVDVALATTAAPTYFPVHTIANVDYIDGGLWANDPTLVAITEYMRMHASKYDGLDILSIGSCEHNIAESPNKKRRSFIDWSNTLFDIYTKGQNQAMSFFLGYLKQFLKFDLNIVRIHGDLSGQQASFISMDTADKNALRTLSGLGKTAGVNNKDKEDVKYFFKTKKTYKI